MLAPQTGFLGDYREKDESTPSLANMEEDEEDDDDIITFENLSDCMGAMTSFETDEMVKSFDLYMQQNHCNEYDVQTDSMMVTNESTRNSSMGSFEKKEGTVHTPEAPWPLSKWLQGRSTSASVDGIHLKNGFEPDLYTLDGIRKELFCGKSW